MQTKILLFGFIIISLFVSVIAGSIQSSNLGALRSETESLISNPQDIDSRPMFQRDPAHSRYSSSKVPETNNTLWMRNGDYPTIQGAVGAAGLTETLDQQQTDTSRTFGGTYLAQSFKPTLTVLTRVDFYVAESIGVTLGIFSSTATENGLRPALFLRSVSVPPSGSFPRWVQFVFSSPISLLPENTYFILVSANDVYYWAASSDDLYSRGEAARWNGISWETWEPQPWDFPFKTYGYTPTLTIRTSGVSSHSSVAVTLNGQSAGTVYDSSPLEVSNDIPWIDGDGTVNIGIDSSRIFSIDPNTRYSFTSWLGPYGTWSDNPFTTGLLFENELFTANFRTQYLTNMTFRDNGGSIDLDPTYIETLAPNSSLATFSSFINQWMDNGTWTLKRVIWQGDNVTPLTDSIYTTTAGGTWNINCRVFLVNFTDSFKDNNGADLYVKPSSFRLTFPNGTTSASLPLGSYLIQNGVTFWSSIIWQESEVTPDTYFDATDGNPTINCEVYSLGVYPNFYDNLGDALIQPSSWSLRFPNGTVRTLSSPVTYNQTQAGSYSIVSVVWKGFEVLRRGPVSVLLNSNMTWSPRINCTLPTSLSLSLSSSTSYIGFKVEIDGNLTCNDIGVSDAAILLSYSVTEGKSWNDISQVNTASDGRYLVVWMPQATGSYIVKVVWAGNSTFPGSIKTVNLAVIPYAGQNVFAVESNSTISALAFNSTSLELSFTVSGETGTRGYVKVTIAKSLVSNIADVKVYLDGNQTEYSATSQDDSWILEFTYTHSPHDVTIDLKPAIVNSRPSPLIYFLTVAIVITLISGILILKRNKLKPANKVVEVSKKVAGSGISDQSGEVKLHLCAASVFRKFALVHMFADGRVGVRCRRLSPLILFAGSMSVVLRGGLLAST